MDVPRTFLDTKEELIHMMDIDKKPVSTASDQYLTRAVIRCPTRSTKAK